MRLIPHAAVIQPLPIIPIHLRTLRDLTLWVDAMPPEHLVDNLPAFLLLAARAQAGTRDLARALVVVSVISNRILFELMQIPKDAAAEVAPRKLRER